MSQLPKDKLKNVPHQPGVYLHKDRLGLIIYVGKAKDLRRRLTHYFTPSRQTLADRKTKALIDSIADFDYHVVRNEQEALLLEGKLIKQYRPRYNVSLRDDKQFLLVKVNLDDPWPKFSTVRFKKDDQARYFGPFAHSGALRATVDWLNREFGLRACRPKQPGMKDYKHCHDDLIKNCSAPCMNRISQSDYLESVKEACSLLEGKGRRARLKTLSAEMEAAAGALDFEKAASLRDVIKNLEKTLSPTRQFSRGRGVPSTVRPLEDLQELADYLGLESMPQMMECFDISNVSSNHIVASMVRFNQGVPDPQNYRRYRIRTVAGQDDFASMAEVVRRRYSRILNENKKAEPEDLQQSQEGVIDRLRRQASRGQSPIILPDLVIVDGGKGQLSMAVRELRALGLEGLPVIGLAKKREEVFRPGMSEPLVIPHDRGALKLLQRIRDEAHRFANTYNELLVRKRIKESLLDDCPGMSPSKKMKLLKKFGSVSKIRKASVGDLAELEGISLQSAQNIAAFLKRK